MELEVRKCKGCGAVFKVLKTSGQEYHSAICEHDNGGRKLVWGVVPQELRKGASAKKNTTEKNTTKIRNSDPGNSRSEEKVTKETKRGNMLEVENTTKSTKKQKMPEDPSGEGQTGIGQMSTVVPTTAKKETMSSTPSKRQGIVVSLTEQSERLYSVLEREQSTSMGLINSSVTQLKTLLDGIVEKHKDSEARSLTSLDVDDACKVAATIGGLMKVKIDAARVAIDMLNTSDRP